MTNKLLAKSKETVSEHEATVEDGSTDAVRNVDVSFEDWLGALRSGDYSQGHSALRWAKGPADGFCCLGVLCDLIEPSWGDAFWTPSGHPVQGGYLDTDHGLAPSWYTQNMRRLGASMNDAGSSFAEIADALELSAPELVGASSAENGVL